MSSSSNNHFLRPNGLDSEPWTSQVVADADTMVCDSVRSSSPASDVMMPERSPSPIPVASPTLYWEPHPLVPAGLLNGPPSDEDLTEHRPDIASTESCVRRFLAVVKGYEVSGNKWALVRTLRRVELICSTKGCEGSGRLHVGQLVQIRHHVSGKFEGHTFIECTAGQCSRATSLAGSPPPSRPPSPDGEWVQVT